MSHKSQKHYYPSAIKFMIWLKHLFENSLMFIVKFLARVEKNTLPHNVNIPIATYSPWKTDLEFQKAYKIIKIYTTVDLYRLYENWKMVEQVKDIPGNILEVGVWKGGSGCLLAHKAKLLNVDATIYMCDTFEGVVKASDKDNKYKGGEFSDTTIELVQSLVDDMSLKNTDILAGIFPDDTGHIIKDNIFRLCHIDVDTYQSAKHVVEWVWPRLSQGGVIIFDDYGFVGCEGVTKYVNEIANDTDKSTVHNLNGHALIFKNS